MEAGVVFAKAKTTVSLEVSASYGHEWSSEETIGKTTEESKEWSMTAPIKVPGGKVYKCQAKVTQAKISVPWVGTVYFKDTRAT